MAGWIGSRSVAIILHTYLTHTFLTTCTSRRVAGSGGNTIDLALLSTGINEEYIKVSVPLKHSTKQIVEHYLQLMENPTTYAIHTEIVAANQLIIVQQPIATCIGWSTLSITTKSAQTHVTYYIAMSTIPRTVHSIP